MTKQKIGSRQDVIDYVCSNKDELALKAAPIMAEYENSRKMFQEFLFDLTKDRDRLLKEMIADDASRALGVDAETIQIVMEDMMGVEEWLYGC